MKRTCEPAASKLGHGSSRPERWLCPGPGERWRDEKTGRPEGSVDKEAAVAGWRKGHHKLPSDGGDTNNWTQTTFNAKFKLIEFIKLEVSSLLCINDQNIIVFPRFLTIALGSKAFLVCFCPQRMQS